MTGIEALFGIAILILSVVVHEVSHGYSADKLGDPTARMAGRLTLNPIAHLDLMGSFIIPALTFALGGFIFGWAKPVPYNPYNIRQKWGEAAVAAAGPASNIALALIFGLFLRFGIAQGFLSGAAVSALALIVFINVLLAIFNLVPVPPLDGSKILFWLLPARFYHWRERLERYGFFLVIIFILLFWRLIIPIILEVFRWITGISFF